MTDKFDLKLFVIQTVRKWYVFIIGLILGALLVGVPYWLINVVFADDLNYRVTILAHETFSTEDYFINYYTWDELVRSDWFLDKVSEDLNGEYTLAELKEYFSADFEADTTVPHIYVTSTDPELSKKLAEASLNAVLSVKEEFDKLTEINILDVSAPEPVYPDVRVLRAFIFGAVIGLFVSLFGEWFCFLLDDSVYIPLLFTEKYGIPMDLSTGEEKGVLVAGEIPEIKEYTDDMVLLIESGAHNGKIIDYVINDIQVNGGTIKKAYLIDANKAIIKSYFLCKSFPHF